MKETHTLIIGASAAGLASAACLQKEGIDYIIVERQPHVANGWRNHYERLHLHTNKKLSGLPFKKYDASLPTYPPRVAVVEYMDNYQKELNINPVFNTEVISVKKVGDVWFSETKDGTIYKSKFVVIATGQTNKPKMATFEGLNTFKGAVMHSSEYKNGKAFKDKNVLVVGFGNSGCEIAIDLYEHGAKPFLSVRSPVNVLPRDILGIPILQLGLLMAPLPPRLADKLNAPLMNLLVGDIRKVGLKKSQYGPLEQIQKEKRIPLLDIGTMKLLRGGKIKAFGDIKNINNNIITFEDDKKQDFDAIILATGYKNELENFVHVDKSRFQDLVVGVDQQQYFGKDGLYFCGFFISPTGMLREIGLDAQKIAKDIAAKK